LTIRIDQRFLIGLLGVLALGGALAIGMYVGGEPAPTATPTAAVSFSQTQPQQVPEFSIPTSIPANALAAEPRIGIEEAKAQLGQPGVIFVDVRDPASYAAGHIEGAINVPEAEMESRLAELPRDQDLILYCA